MILKKIKNKIVNSLYIRNPLNIFAGHKIYGNDSGFIANYVGNLVIKRSRVNKSKSINQQIVKKGIHLKEKGYAFLDLNIERETISEINEEFRKEIKQMTVPADGRLEISSINNKNFYNKLASTKNVFNSEIIQILEYYYQASFKLLNTHIYRTINISKDDGQEAFGSTEYWHNDSSTVDSLKLFILLNDTDEKNGPMHLIDKNDTRKIIKNGFSKYKEGVSNGVIENKCNVIKFVGNAGSALIADTNVCLHRGDIPEPSFYRDMLVFYLSVSDNPFKGIVDEDCVKEQYYGFKRLLN